MAPCWVAERTATVSGENLEGSEARGSLQGHIIFPLLWSLVVDERVGLSGKCCYALV
jgi:hypothetical protein